MKTEIDTSNFDKFEEDEPWINPNPKRKRKDGNFVGFTYNRSDENTKSSLLAALIDLDTMRNAKQSEVINIFFFNRKLYLSRNQS